MKLLALMMMAADLNGQAVPDVVLLDFTASYCQPCQQMVPILNRMEEDSFPVRRIDITKQPSLSRQFNVDRIPTLILLVEGQEQQRFVGLTAEEELRRAMNDAARKLEMSRRPEPEGTRTETTEPPEAAEPQPEAVAATEPQPEQPSGIRAILTNMRDALHPGKPKTKEQRFEFPTFRGQSPDNQQEPYQLHPQTKQASVRVRVTDGRIQDFGTGSIIHSSAGLSTVLTCAHLFQGVGRDAIVKLDVFRDGKTFTYPATVVGGNHNSDLAILQFKSADAMPTVPVAEAGSVQAKDRAFSVGCSNGETPSFMTTDVVSVNRYQGPGNLQCTRDPVRGRSGGGLFNTQGQLIGVCSAADRESHEGLYMAVKPIQELISQLKLEHLFQKDTREEFANAVVQDQPASAETENPFAEEEALFQEMFSNENANLVAAESTIGNSPGVTDPTDPRTINPFEQPQQPQLATTNPPGSRTGLQPNSVPQEVTVIIDGKLPTDPKQVIVIPRPSPWLMQLLTGNQAAPQNELVTAHGADFTAISSRRNTQKLPHARTTAISATSTGAALIPVAR
jgi:S1-C subfamily serine protease